MKTFLSIVYILPNTQVSYKQLQTIGGHIKDIKQKSENARLTTSKLDGVLRFFVQVNIYNTIPFPTVAIMPKKKMTTPSHLYHNESIGGNWYLCEHIIFISNVYKTYFINVFSPSRVNQMHHIWRDSVDYCFISISSSAAIAQCHFLFFIMRCEFFQHFEAFNEFSIYLL